MKAAMVRHDEILEKTIAAHRGTCLRAWAPGWRRRSQSEGCGVCRRGVSAGARRQSHGAPHTHARQGRLHTDEAVIVDDTGYASLPINRCSRLMTAAHGGQIVVSGATEILLRGQLPDGMELVDLGEHRLRDLGRPPVSSSWSGR